VASLRKLLILGWLVACTPATPESARSLPPAPSAISLETARVPEHCRDKPAVTLVETTPVESELDDSPRDRTHEVWHRMIDAAEKSLDIEQFYVANGGRLEPIIVAIERAATRGVTVRLIADAGFAKTYPETLARLEKKKISVRKLDVSKNMGGVQHAKYFVVDGCEVYFGSANFDWRSLEHIHELGLRVRSLEVASSLREVFEVDWALAADEPRPKPTESFGRFPIELEGKLVYRVAFSPRGYLPDERSWDLPQLVSAIDAAKQSVRVELLSYEPTTGDERFEDLDAALRRAGARKVDVKLLVSHWNTRPGPVEHLKALAQAPGLEVRVATIPELEKGFIPFARVIHAKYMVIDDRVVWIGTSNWSGEYFLRSRNVGAVIEGAPLAAEVAGIFDDLWGSSYSDEIDIDKDYPPPRIAQ